MTPVAHDSNEFYTRLFTEDPLWSTPYPNVDEARRWAKIGDYLSEIAGIASGQAQRLRILDIGCGRGWLTHLASVYGDCEGIDPVEPAIQLARRYFPSLTFHVGTVPDLLSAPGVRPFDVAIASEVIEHVVDKDRFMADLHGCLASAGHAIVTTPRGEEFHKWQRLELPGQPIEAWISERELRRLFERHGFSPVRHDRVYLDLPGMSLLHRLCGGPRVSRLFDRLGLIWLHRGLQYLTGFYQVWWVRRHGGPGSAVHD